MKRSIPIRAKLAFILIASLCLSFFLGALAIDHTIEKRFAVLEDREIHDDLHRLAQVISSQVTVLEKTAGDWALWDDSYAFMAGKKKEFAAQNFLQSVLENLDVDTNRFYTLDRKLQSGVDRQGNLGNVSYSQFFDSEIPKLDVLFPSKEDTSIKAGIVVMAGRYFYFASSGIRKSDGLGEANGHAIFLKEMNSTFLAHLANLTGLNTTLGPATKFSPPEIFENGKEFSRIHLLREIPSMDRAFYWAHGNKNAQITLIANDATGKPALTFTFSKSRLMLKEGQRTIVEIIATFLLTSLLAVVILGFFIDKLVGLPVLQLSEQMQNVRKQVRQRVTTAGNDELSRLSQQINEMLATIEDQSHFIQGILHNIQAGFLMVDKNGLIQPRYSEHCEMIFRVQHLENRKLAELLYKNEKEVRIFETILSQILDDSMPEQIATALLPDRLTIPSGRLVTLHATRHWNDNGYVAAVHFTITEISENDQRQMKVS